MKKLLSLLLAAALVLSLGACGKEANPYEKYEELFEYLEREDYDSAMAYIRELAGEPETGPQAAPATEAETEPETTETQPSETEPQPVTVEITMDNWQEYFELREYVEIKKNGFGEFEKVSVYYALVNKDGMSPECDLSDVTMEFSYTKKYVSMSVDLENGTITYGADRGKDPYWDYTGVTTMQGAGNFIGEYYMNRYGQFVASSWTDEPSEDQFSVLDTFEILRIAGTFVYYPQS